MLLSGDTRSANRVIGARELFVYFQAWLAHVVSVRKLPFTSDANRFRKNVAFLACTGKWVWLTTAISSKG